MHTLPRRRPRRKHPATPRRARALADEALALHTALFDAYFDEPDRGRSARLFRLWWRAMRRWSRRDLAADAAARACAPGFRRTA